MQLNTVKTANFLMTPYFLNLVFISADGPNRRAKPGGHAARCTARISATKNATRRLDLLMQWPPASATEKRAQWSSTDS